MENGKYFRRLSVIFLLPLVLMFFDACGLDDYPVIYPIPQSQIYPEMNNRADVYVPTDNSGNLVFRNFVIFYRIYVSTHAELSPSPVNFSAINPLLAQDYNAFRPYIDSDTLVNVNMHDLFTRRGYWYLATDGGYGIESTLDSGVIGRILEFSFETHQNPLLRIGSSEYVLWRTNDSGRFSPRPNRLFINTDELRDRENLIPQINADVVDRAGIAAEERNFTYVAMYIVAVGMHPTTYAAIYSTPSLIHVFMLPDAF